MSWAPAPHAEWVLAVNRGEILPIAEEACRPLTRPLLVEEARARLGLDPSAGIGAIDGDESFVEPLDVALRALEQEAALSLVGRWMTRRYLLRLLEVRYQLARYLAEDPGVVDEVVEAPLVVTGAPRTGTTVLYEVLAVDRALRAPEGWELLRPVPPPTPEEPVDPGRVVLAGEELTMLGAVSSGLDAIHPYSARMPKECVSSMALSFLTEEFTARYHVPSYVDYLRHADLAPAYRAHRLVLQVLQRRTGGRRWLLKSPVHLHGLDDLLATYPDAALVITHRDPLSLLPSVTSLVATLRWAHSDTVDFPAIGRYHADLYIGDLEGLVARDLAGRLDPARTVHVRNVDFAEDPIGTVRSLYRHLDLDLGEGTESAMAAHLAGRSPEQHGGHRYSFSDLGLDPAAVRARVADYQAHFRVPSEH